MVTADLVEVAAAAAKDLEDLAAVAAADLVQLADLGAAETDPRLQHKRPKLQIHHQRQWYTDFLPQCVNWNPTRPRSRREVINLWELTGENHLSISLLSCGEGKICFDKQY